MKFLMNHISDIATFKVPTEGNQVKCLESPHLPNKKHIPVNACYNVFWPEDDSITPPICNYFGELYESLLNSPLLPIALRAVIRMIGKNWRNEHSSGSGLFLLPDVVASNDHVIIEFNPVQEKVLVYNNLWGFDTMNDNGMLFALIPKLLTSTALGDAVNKVMQYERTKDIIFGARHDEVIGWKGVDSILGQQFGVFDLYDLSACRLNCKGRDQTVIMVPSPKVLQVGDEILTLSFPGIEGNHAIAQKYAEYRDWAADSQFLMTNVFNGYGKVCISAGNILAPYHLDSNQQWVPNIEHVNTKDNHDILVSDECLIFGCSGGAVISKDCRVVEIEGLTLVEFHSVHTGGEFIKCKECLKHHKEKSVVSDWKNWNFCDKCIQEGSSLERGMGYNCSLSVHGLPFVKLYSSKILPSLMKLIKGDLDSVPFLKEYCTMHDILPTSKATQDP